jgi:hypothetical protein
MTRAELYALVWESPLVHLAKRLGISNTRLKRICDHYDVPVPPPGYWAKRAAGKPANRQELPNPPHSILGKFNSALRRIGEIPLQIADGQISEFEPQYSAEPEDDVPSEALHPYIQQLRRVLSDSPVDVNGFVTSKTPTLPTVRVSPSLIDRTVHLIDRLIAVVYRRGHKITRTGGEFRIAVAGEPFELKVYETRERIGGGSTGRRFRASGKLCMEISDPREFRWSTRNLVGQWHDRRNQPLEGCYEIAVTASEAAAQRIQYCRTLAHDRQVRLREEQARAKRAEQEAEFLERSSATYRALLELKQFANFLKSTAPSDDETAQRMLARISARVEQLEAELAFDRLAADARKLDLFTVDDSTC